MVNQETLDSVLEIRILGGFVARSARNDLERRLAVNNVGVSSLQFFVIRLLSYKNFTIKELSRKLSLEPATLVPVVDTLERLELVKRGRDPQDRRRTPLTLTENGYETLGRISIVDPGDSLVRGLDKLGKEKSQQLLSLLHELAREVTEDQEELSEILSAVHLWALPPAAKAAH